MPSVSAFDFVQAKTEEITPDCDSFPKSFQCITNESQVLTNEAQVRSSKTVTEITEHSKTPVSTVNGFCSSLFPTVITSWNGFWKQENLDWSPMPNGHVNTSIPVVISDSESEEDILIRKHQPMLRNDRSTSESDDSCEAEQSNASRVRAPPIAARCSNPNRKSGLTPYARAKMMAALKAKRKLGTLAAQAKLAAEASACSDCRKPWFVGDLVWVRPKRPCRLPWWPSIIVNRPRKLGVNKIRNLLVQGSLEKYVPEFRVCLLGPIRAENLIVVPQDRIRPYRGRDEFESFMRESVLEADDKIKALCQFTIQPSFQHAWHLAREAAEAAQQMNADAPGRLALFPWATEDQFRDSEGYSSLVPGRTSVNVHARYPTSWLAARKRMHKSSRGLTGSSSSGTDESDASQPGSLSTEHRYPASTGSVPSGRHSKFKKYAKPASTAESGDGDQKADTAFAQKDLANRFEFERLRFLHMAPKRIFVCSACGEPGELAQKPNATEPPTPPCKKISIDPAPVDMHYPPIDACVGGCGTYLHPGCARQIEIPSTVKNKQPPSALPDPTAENHGDSQEPCCTPQSGLASSQTEASQPPVDQAPPVLRIRSVCELCMSGYRQCFICNRKQACSQILAPTSQSSGHDASTGPATNESSTPAEPSNNDHPTGPSSDSASTGQSVNRLDDPKEPMIRCSMKTCSRWFHPSCLRRAPFSATVRDRRAGAFSCPAHTCLACTVENPGTIPRPSPRYIRCFLCPVAYHPGEWCLPAGSREIAPNWIICPRHALGDHFSLPDIPTRLKIPPLTHPLATMFRPTNVSWCFICSKGGRIICCEQCPASFHEECLKIDEVPDKFVCEDCLNGRFPRYGEIVWARLPPNLNSVRHSLTSLRPHNPRPDVGTHDAPGDRSAYASLTVGMYWWPGEVVHPRHLPAGSSRLDAITDGTVYETCDSPTKEHTAAEEHALGLFPIRLFGLTAVTKRVQTDGNPVPLPVVLWTTRARLFPYEEGDDKREVSSSSSDTDSADDEITVSGRRRSGCLDDGEDEDPLLQLDRVIDGQSPSKQNHQPVSPPKSGSSVPALSPVNLRPRSARRQRLSVSKRSGAKAHGRQHRTAAEATLAAQRKETYEAAVKQAANGWSGRREKFGQLLGRTRRPDYYKPIKVNWPLGAVRVYRLSDLSEAPRCECKPGRGTDPCGPTSNCINRELHYECLPSVCPNGEACQNQRFTKRLYPAQRPFWTGSERGWGLKALVPIKTGEFVNEYIGDLIDEDEANRRLRFAHENNVTNYYMMKLDSQRIIDAGPKGNLSRFMNHSCDPNLNTQKWTVNGDNRIGLFAVRDIMAGEELTFNYNFVALGQERLNCQCGSSNCAGFLGTSTASNGAHSSQRVAEDDSAATDSRVKRQHTSAAAAAVGGDAAKGSGVTECSKVTGAHSSVSGKNANPTENVLIRQPRHEHVCYRCKASTPPNRTTGTEDNDSNSAALSKLGHTCSKRGLERELEDLVAHAVNCSPVKDSTASITSKQTVPATAVVRTDSTSSDRTKADGDLIYCAKTDCPKAYHLQCLDLCSVPQGRWCCPWHHCDACGRPSHIFCSLCPASFCLAHVEGSIAVLPPVTNARSNGRSKRVRSGEKLYHVTGKEPHTDPSTARVVCMSHTELIRKFKEESVQKTPTARKPFTPVDISSNTMTSPNSVVSPGIRTRHSSDLSGRPRNRLPSLRQTSKRHSTDLRTASQVLSTTKARPTSSIRSRSLSLAGRRRRKN